MIVKKRTAIHLISAALFMILFAASAPAAERLKLDERPAEPGEWGYRPANGDVSQVNPPSFSWRPQSNLTWEIQCARDAAFEKIVYEASNLEFNVHCPAKTFKPGSYTWRYRGKDSKGNKTNWSRARKFTIANSAVAMP